MTDTDRDLIRTKLDELISPGVVCIPGVPDWDGPFYTPPEETAAFWAANNKPDQHAWEVWVQLTDDPDVDHPEHPSEPTRASVGLSDDEATELDLRVIAKRLASNAAGRAAHETLERATFRGEQLLDPHAPREVLHEIATVIALNVYDYLMKAPSRTTEV